MPLLETRQARRRALRAGALIIGIAPLVGLVMAALGDGLGANPVEEITHETGEWALRFLVACLMVTPLRRLTGWRMLTLERRTLGLFAFLYAALHLTTYVALDLGFDWANLGEDIRKRPYITVGFTTFCLLLTLASTSTRAAARRLGHRWKKLHRLVYLAGIGAVVHFFWLVKADTREPLIYAAVVATLLSLRLWWAFRLRRAAAAE
ncbi:MAG: protein-methionine-sulfoxide reductase heme-binding subunit MsrQ [Myxococcota bacterium]|nr:protein-methionine-sulfoxide reductase heme-binding subunit MsrQ [Myxococcota bacterium]